MHLIIRNVLLSAPLLLIGTALQAQPAAAPSAPAAAPAAGAKFSGESQIGALLDDPAAKAVLQKHIPEIVGSDQIEMARGMTLTQIAGFPQAGIDEAKLKAILADLAALK
jgi:para-nitrobenzyl esterase